jgi:hypothetical protein
MFYKAVLELGFTSYPKTIGKNPLEAGTHLRTFFFIVFTQEWTAHILRFDFNTQS